MNQGHFHISVEYAQWNIKEKTPRQDVSNLAIEVEIMQTSHKFHTANFIRFLYDGSILFFYVLALVMTVAVGAYGLEILFSIL